MSFGDVAARLKKKQEEQAPPPPVERNFGEIHALRARILGVLIRDARVANAVSEEELAAAVNVPVDDVRRWEFGQEAPSLPQLETIAYFLGVPISRFWEAKTVQEVEDERPAPDPAYGELRDRVIGALLTIARKDARLSQEELATATGLSTDQIVAYEFGQQSIPFSELTSLASAVRKSMSYFLEDTGSVGHWLILQEEYRRFSELPSELRAFVALPVNQPFIDIALRLSKMPVQDLRQLAENLLEITL